jgi:hypothetical protein
MYTLYYIIVLIYISDNEKRETKYDMTSVVACDDPYEELDVHNSGNNDDTL